MSLPVNVGDFLATAKFAWRIYRLCKDSANDFKSLASEASSLHIALKETEDIVAEYGADLGNDRLRNLLRIREGCESVLVELEELLNKYDRLGSSSRRTWDRLRWGMEPISTIRSQLTMHVNLLTTITSSLSLWSNFRLERKLEMYMRERRAGLRERSVVSSATIDSLVDDDGGEADAWIDLQRELEDIGISDETIAARKDFIITWFRNAFGKSPPGSPPHSPPQFEQRESFGYSGPGPAETAPRRFRPATASLGFDPPPAYDEVEHYRPRGRSQPTPPQPTAAQLQTAIKNNDSREVRALLDMGADVNGILISAKGARAIHVAAGTRGSGAVLEILRRPELQINAQDSAGHTALMVACLTDATSIVSLFTNDPRVDPNVRNAEGETALYIAAKSSSCSVKTLHALLTMPYIDPNVQTRDNQCAILAAFQLGDVDKIFALLQHGQTDINVRSFHGDTILHAVCRAGQRELISILLDHPHVQADEQNDKGQTPLALACERGHTEIAEALLRRPDVNPNKADFPAALTPLHYACMNKQEEVVRSLLSSSRIDPNKFDKAYRTPLSWALEVEDEKSLLRLAEDVRTDFRLLSNECLCALLVRRLSRRCWDRVHSVASSRGQLMKKEGYYYLM